MIVTDNHGAHFQDIVDLSAGDLVQQAVEFSLDDVRAFSELTADTAPVHFDADFARGQGYEGPIVHGLLVSSRFSRLLGMHLPGPKSVIQSLSLSYRSPVYPNTLLLFEAKIQSISVAVGAVTLGLTCRHADTGSCLAIGKAVCVMRSSQF